MAGMHSSGRKRRKCSMVSSTRRSSPSSARSRGGSCSTPLRGVFPSPLLTATGLGHHLRARGRRRALKARLETRGTREGRDPDPLGRGKWSALVPYLCREGVTQAVFCPGGWSPRHQYLAPGVAQCRPASGRPDRVSAAGSRALHRGRTGHRSFTRGQGTISCPCGGGTLPVPGPESWGSQHGAVRPTAHPPASAPLVHRPREPGRARSLSTRVRASTFVPKQEAISSAPATRIRIRLECRASIRCGIAEALDRAERTVPGLRPFEAAALLGPGCARGFRTRPSFWDRTHSSPGYFWMAGLGRARDVHRRCCGPTSFARPTHRRGTRNCPGHPPETLPRVLGGWEGGRRLRLDSARPSFSFSWKSRPKTLTMRGPADRSGPGRPGGKDLKSEGDEDDQPVHDLPGPVTPEPSVGLELLSHRQRGEACAPGGGWYRRRGC
jgi:hypothetical protein